MVIQKHNQQVKTLRVRIPFPGFSQYVSSSLAFENRLYDAVQEERQQSENAAELNDYGIDFIYDNFEISRYEDEIAARYFELYLEAVGDEIRDSDAIDGIEFYCCRTKFRPAGEWEMICTVPQENIEILKSLGVIGEMWPESNSGCSYEFMLDPEEVFNCETGYGQQLYEAIDEEILSQVLPLIPQAIEAQKEDEERRRID